MKTIKTTSVLAILTLLLLQLVACQPKQSTYVHVEPAHLEHIDGSDLSRLTLTEKAITRIDIKTVPVEYDKSMDAENSSKMVVPYASVLYDPHGKTWVYTNPEPLVFIRHEIKVDYITGDIAVLSDGPPEGTMVVTSGAAELLGTEYEVGH